MPSKIASNPLVASLFPPGSPRRASAGRLVRKVAPSLLPPPKQKPTLTPAERAKRQEEAKLRGVWKNLQPEMLELYLVTGFQDPRLNAQSILARHTLIRALFGSQFDQLMHEELQFAAELNDAIRIRGEELGVSLTATMDPEKQAGVQQVMAVIADRAPLFAQRWREALAGQQATPLRVIEFACGSANDYRAMADYGVAAFLDYTGIDLNEKNIANAKRRFPDVDFRVASILSLTEADQSVDYVLGFDILEHLSLAGMDTAVTTAVRIARRGLYFCFFRMDEVPENEEHPRGAYHYNLLSRARMQEYMEQRYASVQLVHIPTMFADDYAYPHSGSYNRRAYSLIAENPR